MNRMWVHSGQVVLMVGAEVVLKVVHDNNQVADFLLLDLGLVDQQAHLSQGSPVRLIRSERSSKAAITAARRITPDLQIPELAPGDAQPSRSFWLNTAVCQRITKAHLSAS